MVVTGPPGDAVAAGHNLDREVHEQRRGTADQVGTDAAMRQFGHIREAGKLSEHHGGGLDGIGPRH